MRYFVAVAEERSFSRAAERLHITQQSLSAAVRKLEARIGCELFVRTTRTVELTAPGRALLGTAPGVLAAADGALAATRAAGEMGRATLRVRYGLDCEHLLKPLLRAFAAAHPAVELSAWTGVDVENLQAVRQGRADAAFAWALRGHAGDLVYVDVGGEECVLAMPAAHPLARFDPVPRSLVARHAIVMFPRDPVPTVWDLLVDQLGFGASNERLHVLPLNGQDSLVERALELGALCPVSRSLLPQLTVRQQDLAMRPLDPPLTVPLHLTWRHPAPAAVHALAAIAHGT